MIRAVESCRMDTLNYVCKGLNIRFEIIRFEFMQEHRYMYCNQKQDLYRLADFERLIVNL
jgi:hypothetical protein